MSEPKKNEQKPEIKKLLKSLMAKMTRGAELQKELKAIESELAGLTISSSLVGNPASGPINPASIGLLSTDSTLLVDKDYFIDSGTGIDVVTTASGTVTQGPSLVNDAIIGNINGIVIADSGSGSSTPTTAVVNDTVAYNTIGMEANNDSSTSSDQAYIANSIFWQNHDQTIARSGYGIYSQTANHLLLNNNMFSGNGINDTTIAYAAVTSATASTRTTWVPTPVMPRPTWATTPAGRPSSHRWTPGQAATVRPFSSTTPTTAWRPPRRRSTTPSSKPRSSTGHRPTCWATHRTRTRPRRASSWRATARADVGAFEYEPVSTAGTTAIGGLSAWSPPRWFPTAPGRPTAPP